MSGAPFSYRLGPLVPSQSVVLFGDSQTQNNNFGAPTTNYGFWSWFEFYSNACCDVIYNAGISGNTTSQMLARISKDVTSYSPRFVHFLGGTNDYPNGILCGTAGTGGPSGYGVGTTIDNIYRILMQCLQCGAQVIVGSILPREGTPLAQAQNNWNVTAWIREFAHNSDGVYFMDYYNLLSDVSTMSNTLLGQPLESLFVDGLHGNPAGSAIMGAALNSIIGPMLERPNARVSSNRVGALGDQSLINDNALCILGTGGALGPGVTAKASGLGPGEVGGVPQTWQISGGAPIVALASVVPRANYWNDGKQGSAMRIDLSGATSDAQAVVVVANVSSVIPAGEYIVECEVYAQFTSGTLALLVIQNVNIPNAQGFIGGQGDMNQSSMVGTIRTAPFSVVSPISGGTFYMQMSTSIGAVGYVCLTNFVMRPYTVWTPH